jgi:hypothetical protein
MALSLNGTRDGAGSGVVRRILLLAHIARRILVCERIDCLIPGTADGILHLAGCPLSGAIGLELCIANDSAETFLYRPLDLVADSLDSILVHLFAPSFLSTLRMRPLTDVSLFKTAHPAASEA